MTEKGPSTQFEAEIRAALNAPEADPAFVAGLRARLAQRNAEFASLRRRLSRRTAWAVSLAVVLVLVLSTLAIGPQRVLAAFRGLFGYLPGIGLVQNDAGLRVLSGPVTMQREGVTLTLEQGAADAARTVVVYRAEGLSTKAANSQGEGASTGGLAVLLLPDGSILTQNGGDSAGWGTGYQSRLIFPALPKDVGQAKLMISRLESMPSGAAPENWQIALDFKPAQQDLKVMPVYELATPQGLAAQATPASGQTAETTTVVTQPTQANVATQQGITLSLDKVIEREDGFLLQGSATWSLQDPISTLELDFYHSLTDANGQEIPVEPAEVDNPPASETEHMVRWAVRTAAKNYPGPWTLNLSAVHALEFVPDPAKSPASFEIDLGAAPTVGQTWQINQVLNMSGRQVRVTTASLSRLLDGRSELTFQMEGGPEITNADLMDPAASTSSGGGGGYVDPGDLSRSIQYDPIPSGVHKIYLTGIGYTLSGPWQVSWAPPASTGQTAAATPAPAAGACLTLEKYQALKAQAAGSLPAGLDGRVLVEKSVNQLMPQIFAANLDGSQARDLAIGGWSALSPDGKTAAFIKSDGPGLFLADTASGDVRPLAGTTKDDYSPVWSPDGQWIAFVRANDGIHIIHPDGSGLKQVTDASTLSFPAGWMPDSARLVVTTLGPGGSQVQIVDTASGEHENTFLIANAKGGFAQLSPDGKRLAFSENVFGQFSYGVWVADLDGANKRLVAGLETLGAAAGPWSPDTLSGTSGKWLVVDVPEDAGGNYLDTSLLVNPESCEVVRLGSGAGRIVGWAGK